MRVRILLTCAVVTIVSVATAAVATILRAEKTIDSVSGTSHGEKMLNTSCRTASTLQGRRPDNNGCGDVAAAAEAQPVDPDKSLRLQACWIRLWDRWACEQRNLVLYQMHINHALSRERSKLTLAGGRLVSCRRKQQSASARGCPVASAAAPGRPHAPLHRSKAASATAATAAVPPPIGQDAASARDLRVLSAAVDQLRTSGWYYEGADEQARAAAALARTSAGGGGFYVRDSKHSAHLFTLDVAHADGRFASVRFTYADGAFGLESMPRRTGCLRFPKFRCPIELIDYYVRLSGIDAACRMFVHPAWIDRRGQFFSLMDLRRPLVKTDANGFPSLKHITRLVINRHKRLIPITPTSLPNELIEYLLQYPYSL